ncbi:MULTISPECIES: hypothetical protein [Streptomyces]|uniref:Uncharacterized protein n=1 Tax=Streptomyces fimbriatus TaxID=68197 RepID=A0ABW0D2U9_STRFI
MTVTVIREGAASGPLLPARARALFLVLVSLLAALPAAGLVVTTGGWGGGQRPGTTVADTGDVPAPGWTVDRTLPDGRWTDGPWRGSAAHPGRGVVVHGGSRGPGGSAALGRVVPGAGDDGGTSLPCRVG